MNIRIPSDVVFRDLSGEGALLNLATGTYFGLDEVGTKCWHLIGSQGTLENVVTALLHEYEIDEPQLRSDLTRLLQQLSDKGLVVIDQTETPATH